MEPAPVFLMRRKDRPEISVLTLARRILDGPPRYLEQLLPLQAIAPIKQQAIEAYDIGRQMRENLRV
jgi:hypothetical protein